VLLMNLVNLMYYNFRLIYRNYSRKSM